MKLWCEKILGKAFFTSKSFFFNASARVDKKKEKNLVEPKKKMKTKEKPTQEDGMKTEVGEKNEKSTEAAEWNERKEKKSFDSPTQFFFRC
jgi:hypothetical protein